MEPRWLLFVDGFLLLTLFAVAPLITAVIGYATYRGWPKGFGRQRFVLWSASTLLAAVALLATAKLLDADVRTPLYLLQAACFEVGAVLFGVGGGFTIGMFIYQWGERARLQNDEANPGSSRLRAVYWAVIIVGVNLADVALMTQIKPAGRDGIDTFSGIIFALQFVAFGGSYWMLADWFIKKGQRSFKKWMWLFFAPWGWLWYLFEVHPFVRRTDEQAV